MAPSQGMFQKEELRRPSGSQMLVRNHILDNWATVSPLHHKAFFSIPELPSLGHSCLWVVWGAPPLLLRAGALPSLKMWAKILQGHVWHAWSGLVYRCHAYRDHKFCVCASPHPSGSPSGLSPSLSLTLRNRTHLCWSVPCHHGVPERKWFQILFPEWLWVPAGQNESWEEFGLQ